MNHERYEGGSEAAELADFERLARDLVKVQARNRRRSGRTGVDRVFHAKAALGVRNARLEVDAALPVELRQGPFLPGAVLDATVRLSNASGTHQPDTAKDLRGLALRVEAGDGTVHDLLTTNYEVSPAANAHEFVAMAVALAGVPESPVLKALALLLRLPRRVGFAATRRILLNLRRSVTSPPSMAGETYFSRGAIRWGSAGPVRYRLAPHGYVPGPPSPGPDGLHNELARRLAAGDIVFELLVQRYRDDVSTPVEDTSRGWDAPAVPVARLVVPQQHIDSADAQLVARQVEQLAFNPWHTTEQFRPLGHLNRARRAAYDASAAHRRRQQFSTEVRPLQGVAEATADRAFGLLGRLVVWHRLPARLALLNLTTLRRQLREHNLLDTDPAPTRVQVGQPRPLPSLAVRRQRTDDGTDNDLSAPAMGAVGARFGRNMPLDAERPDRPDPIRVSDELLARERFIPARSLNVLAAAWIQFQVHDWVNHRRFPVGEASIDLPLPPGRTWRNTVGGAEETVMRIAANDGDGNTVSHWWDGSEVYGSASATAAALREGGGAGARLRLEDGYLPFDEHGRPRSGFTDSWWLGLSVMQTLLAREHNAVCDALHAEYPDMSEERIHQIARLIVSALIAKIHTVEWTPAILGTRTLDTGMNINWSGPGRDRLTRLGLRLFDPHALHGIPGSLPDHHGVPYSLTEEFVTVYRMHPLIPDDYVFVDHADGSVRGRYEFADLQGAATEPMLRKIGLTDACYSLAIAHPGAVTLHNFPRGLRRFERDGEFVDLAVVDIVRTRCRRVPRYNDFRAGLHRPRIRSFDELTSDPETLARLQALYPTVDDIDTVVGLLAENPPAGFGFSDTAFRVFLLMASRRLQSDRFLTVDFRPEIYTPLGMDWIERNGLSTVLLRHCPELAGTIGQGKAVFAPWP